MYNAKLSINQLIKILNLIIEIKAISAQPTEVGVGLSWAELGNKASPFRQHLSWNQDNKNTKHEYGETLFIQFQIIQMTALH